MTMIFLLMVQECALAKYLTLSIKTKTSAARCKVYVTGEFASNQLQIPFYFLKNTQRRGERPLVCMCNLSQAPNLKKLTNMTSAFRIQKWGFYMSGGSCGLKFAVVRRARQQQ